MEIKFIISLMLFGIFFSYDNYEHYYLKDGIEKNITHLSSKDYRSYLFEINFFRVKGAIFTIKTPYGCKLDSTLKIYEYEISRPYKETYKENNIKGKLNNSNNICEYSYFYTLSSPLSRTIAFETGFSNFYYSKVFIITRIDIVQERYDLYNKKSLDIFDLSLNNSYYIYLEFFEKADITFVINNITQKPFSDTNIYEFGTINNSIINNIIKRPISFHTNNNQSIASFSYSSNSNITKYIALQIKPSFNISQMIAKYECSVISFKLNEGVWKTIDNLINNQIYLFYVEVTETSKINISLIINNTDNAYDEYELPIIFNDGSIGIPNSIPNYIDINVYEYESQNNSYISYIQKSNRRLYKERKIYFMTKNKTKINSTFTKYCAFSFKPNFDIKQMSVNVNISGGVFDLFNNTPKNIINLRPDHDYFFIINAHQYNFINLTSTINNYTNVTTNPFSYIYYYYLENRQYYNSFTKYEKLISPIINEDKIIITQNVSSYYTRYIYFRIKPSYYIENMIINVDVTNYLYDLDNYRNTKSIYFLKRNIAYYIKMNVWNNYKTKLDIKLYNMSNIPFSYIQIYESLYPDSMTQWTKNISKKIKFKKNNNIYEFSIEKENTLNKHLFLFIEIIPEYDINYMVAETTMIEKVRIDISLVIFIIIGIIIFALMIIYIIYLFKKCLTSKLKDLSLSSLDWNNQNEFIPQN